jgi:hypothetical protein
MTAAGLLSGRVCDFIWAAAVVVGRRRAFLDGIGHFPGVIGHCSGVIGRFPGVIAHCSSMIAHFPSVIAHFPSVIAHCSSMIAHCSSVIAHFQAESGVSGRDRAAFSAVFCRRFVRFERLRRREKKNAPRDGSSPRRAGCQIGVCFSGGSIAQEGRGRKLLFSGEVLARG